MNKINLLIAGSLLVASMALQSCDQDNEEKMMLWQPTALVTVCPQSDESVLFQLDEETVLNPVNLRTSPYGKKEVRALVNYTLVNEDQSMTDPVVDVNVNWIDSIRTKMPVKIESPSDYDKFANDPVEIIRDWVTVAEDGYLTLRLRTVWTPGVTHTINLIYDETAGEPLVFELRHDACGDTQGRYSDALIAFNLNEVIADMPKPVTFTLKWKSFSGEKSIEVKMDTRKPIITDEPQTRISPLSID